MNLLELLCFEKSKLATLELAINEFKDDPFIEEMEQAREKARLKIALLYLMLEES